MEAERPHESVLEQGGQIAFISHHLHLLTLAAEKDSEAVAKLCRKEFCVHDRLPRMQERRVGHLSHGVATVDLKRA